MTEGVWEETSPPSVWAEDGSCSRAENIPVKSFFFSKDGDERRVAKGLCHGCPVRRDCLRWSLESKQIWGVWGGRDEVQNRRTLSVGHDEEETRRRRPSDCPYCGAGASGMGVSTVDLPGGGRWTTAKVVSCSGCGFSWRSRTSANSVEAYQNERRDRLNKRAKSRSSER